MAYALIQEISVIKTETRIVKTSRGFWKVQSRIVGGPGEWIDVSAPKICREDAEAFRAAM